MRHRTAFLGAMALTAFLLIIVAGVITRLAATPPSGSPPSDPLVLPPANATLLPEQGTAEYQQAIETANARLGEANRQLEDAYRRLTPQPNATNEPSAAPATAQYPFSAAQASVLAGAAVAGATPVAPAELVDLNGIPAYAVTFPNGVVYVDANNGQILANTANPPAAAAPNPLPNTNPNPAPPSQNNPAPAAQITADQAVSAALAYVGGGTVERVRLEEEHGQLVYEVRFTNDNRVYVDPQTGRVVYARLEGNNDKGSND